MHSMSRQDMTFRNAGVAVRLEDARFQYQMSGPRPPARSDAQRQLVQRHDENKFFFPTQHNIQDTEYAATQCCNQPVNVVEISAFDLDLFSSRPPSRNITGAKKTTGYLFGRSGNA
jgi:hypothetical protein